MKVAIVEDDAVMALLLEEICRTCGYQIVGPAATVGAAVPAIVRERPDCLLFDFSLRGKMNGLDLLERVKRYQPAIFTVMITAWDINDIASRMGAIQPDRILRKPIYVETLTRILVGATRRSPVATSRMPCPSDVPDIHVHASSDAGDRPARR